MSCKWVASDRPRVIVGRHGDECSDCRLWGRIQSRITVEDRGYTSPCWISGYATNRDGYTLIRIPSTRISRLLHRVTYTLLVGPIPEGMTLDHLCRVRRCCNPEHLEPVTNVENVMRGEGFAPKYATATHCVNGHEFTPENTRTRTRPEGGRDCKACNTERARKRRHAKGRS